MAIVDGGGGGSVDAGRRSSAPSIRVTPATSIIRGPPPSPLFGKTASGILVLIACRFLGPPRPPQTSSPLWSIQLVLQERPELPLDDHIREGHVAGYCELLDEQSPQSLRLVEEARSEVIPR